MLGDAPVVQCLVIGGHLATVIDTGVGVYQEFSRTIRSLTGRPLICLLTHGGPDHIGGAGAFDHIYMNANDDTIARDAFRAERRLGDVKMTSGNDTELLTYMNDNMDKSDFFTYTPVNPGDKFDLGSITLTAYHLSGHTPGSMCFVDYDSWMAFTGDSVASMTQAELLAPRCTSLATYQNALATFALAMPHEIALYSGHKLEPFDRDIFNQMETGCQEILDGDTVNDEHADLPFAQLKDTATFAPKKHFIGDGKYQIFYNAAKLH